MGLVPNPVDDAFAQMQAHGIIPQQQDQGAEQWLPYLERQSYDPTASNFDPSLHPGADVPAYGDTTQMPAEVAARGGVPGQQAPVHLPDGAAAPIGIDRSRQAAPGSVEEASGEEQDALSQARRDTIQSAKDELAVKRQTATAQADATLKAADEQGKLDDAYSKARDAAHVAADQETASWLQSVTTKVQQEPNPDRWWENRSDFGKSMWLMSLAFSSLHSAITPGARNVALDMIQQNIKDDVSSQKQRLEREVEALKFKGKVMSEQQARKLSDTHDDHTMALGKLATLREAWTQRAAVPGDAADAAAVSAGNLWFDQKGLELAGKKREEAFHARESGLARDHATAIAQMEDKSKRDIAAANIQKDYDLAKMQYDAAGALSAGSDHKNEVPISPNTGAVLVDAASGKPVGDPGDEGTVYVNQHMKPDEVAAKMTSANQNRSDLLQLRKALADDASFSSMIAGNNVEYQQAISRLKQAGVAGQGGLGHTTDKDMDVVTKAITGVGDGTSWSRVNAAAQRAEALKAVDRTIANQKAQVENELSPHARKKGTKVVWFPQDTTAPTPRALTPDEQVAQLGGKPEGTQAPKNPAELRALRERGADERVTGPAAAGVYAPVVENFTKNVQDATPDHIRALATAALSAVTPDSWAGRAGSQVAKDALIPAAREDALKIAEKRESDMIKYLTNETHSSFGTLGQAPTPAHVREVAETEFHLTNGLDPKYIDKIIRDVEAEIRK